MTTAAQAIAELPHWIVWTQRHGAKVDVAAQRAAALKRGVVGRTCAWCGVILKGRRTIWCSDEHRDRFYQFAIWTRLRDFIFARDEGRCTRCGRRVGSLGPHPSGFGSLGYVEWEVDHIKRVCDGGTDHPDNLRLLCRKPCHIEVGYEQRAACS